MNILATQEFTWTECRREQSVKRAGKRENPNLRKGVCRREEMCFLNLLGGEPIQIKAVGDIMLRGCLVLFLLLVVCCVIGEQQQQIW